MTSAKPVDPAQEKPSFWTTLPGILAGLAAVIGAITALLVALGKAPDKSATATPAASAPAPLASAPQPNPVSASPPQEATADNGSTAVNVSGGGNQVSVGK